MLSGTKMWSKKSTLALIEDIRRHPCLWDTQCEDYKRRVKKIEAYRALGAKYRVNPKEIDLKFQALKNQFRREHRRLERNEEGLSPKQIYWFGYEHLLFLLNNCVKPAQKTSENVSVSDVGDNDTEAQDFKHNYDTEYTEYVENEALDSESDKMTTPIKLTTVKTNKGTATATEAFKCMRTLAEKVCSRDEFDIYGEYIAYKLRESGRSNREIAIAQHEINTICFKLTMGELAQNFEGSIQGSVRSNPETEMEEVRYEYEKGEIDMVQKQ